MDEKEYEEYVDGVLQLSRKLNKAIPLPVTLKMYFEEGYSAGDTILAIARMERDARFLAVK